MINYYWHSEKGYFLWGTQWKGYLFLIFWAHCGYVSQSFVQASVPSWPGSALPGEQSDQYLHWSIHNILWHFWKIKLSLICIKKSWFSHFPAVKVDFFLLAQLKYTGFPSAILQQIFVFIMWTKHMSHVMRKPCLCHMLTTKAQISLRIRAVWSAPLLFAA